MTDQQLYLSIGIPILFNAVLIGLLWSHMNSRFDGSFHGVNQRFDDMKDFWRAELRRFEEVLDSRLKRIEERR